MPKPHAAVEGEGDGIEAAGDGLDEICFTAPVRWGDPTSVLRRCGTDGVLVTASSLAERLEGGSEDDVDDSTGVFTLGLGVLLYNDSLSVGFNINGSREIT